MDESIMQTPVQKKDKRRVSFMHRRVLGSPGSPFSPGTPLRGNNDKLEKLARRRSLAHQLVEKKMTDSPFKAPRPDIVRSDAAGAMTATQLTDLYANCIKMCSENKINQKNSWELPLIDYITDVMSARPGELTNFQMASVTLDASVKIYSCRVDSIHSEAYKVLGGISRSEKKSAQGISPDDDEAGDDADGDENGAKKKQKRRARAVNTLENNPSALNVKKFDLQFDIDPLFKQTSAAFDEGGARGLLLNHLTVDENGTLLFDSQGGAVERVEEEESIPEDAFTTLFGDWQRAVGDMEPLEICPSLADFLFMGWEPQQGGIGADDMVISTAQRRDVQATPLKVNMNAEGGHFDLGDSDDDCGDCYDAFADAFEDTIMPDMASHQEKRNFGLAPMTAAMTLALQDGADTEYSYFNEAVMKNWAGPSHWKFQKRDKKADPVQGRKKKEKFFIDFESEAPSWEECFATSRAATTLAKSTLTRKPEEFLLPVDVQYKFESLTRLFTKPSMRIVRKADDSSEDFAVPDGQWYDYNNPNDANNYCGPSADGAVLDDDDDDIGFTDDRNDDWSDSEQTGFPTVGDSQDSNSAFGMGVRARMDLIDEPIKAQKIDIHYAKQAKRINVKQVKSSMWNMLTSSSPSQADDKENDTNNNAVVSATGEKFTEVTKQQQFSDIVNDVPHLVSQQMGEQLSVPILFVCLLHLANEKHLKISNSEDLDLMDDLGIIQG
eukprot:m.135289 g.135289  ORF g.135289 m.135289 type:complete len:723 (+) comp15844_c5_seq2:106-2274(+)